MELLELLETAALAYENARANDETEKLTRSVLLNTSYDLAANNYVVPLSFRDGYQLEAEMLANLARIYNQGLEDGGTPQDVMKACAEYLQHTIDHFEGASQAVFEAYIRSIRNYALSPIKAKEHEDAGSTR